MLELNFRTPDGATEVDLLVSESERFDELREAAVHVSLEGRSFHIASIDDLIVMKTKACRPQDLLDIQELLAIAGRRG